jgi:hypothetical protein
VQLSGLFRQFGLSRLSRQKKGFRDSGRTSRKANGKKKWQESQKYPCEKRKGILIMSVVFLHVM